MRLFFPVVIVAAGVGVSSVARAQHLDTVIAVSGGTGLSLGSGADQMIKKRSPIFLEIAPSFIIDGDKSLEWTPKLLLELEGKVAAAINPSVRKVYHFIRVPLALYGGIGVPFFFAPFSMLGVEASVGVFYQFASQWAVVADFRTNIFFFGSDLPDGTAVAKLDVGLGIRFSY